MIAINRTADGDIRIDGMATDSGSELGWAVVSAVDGEVALVGTHASCAPSASALAAGIEMAKALLETMPQFSKPEHGEGACGEIHRVKCAACHCDVWCGGHTPGGADESLDDYECHAPDCEWVAAQR